MQAVGRIYNFVTQTGLDYAHALSSRVSQVFQTINLQNFAPASLLSRSFRVLAQGSAFVISKCYSLFARQAPTVTTPPSPAQPLPAAAVEPPAVADSAPLPTAIPEPAPPKVPMVTPPRGPLLAPATAGAGAASRSSEEPYRHIPIRASDLPKRNGRAPDFIFPPEIQSMYLRDLNTYVTEDHENPKSYWALKKICTENEWIAPIVEFNDEKKQLLIYAPISYFKYNTGFTSKLHGFFSCPTPQYFLRPDFASYLTYYIPVVEREDKKTPTISTIYTKPALSSLSDLMTKNLCFGEIHEQYYSKKIIQQNMALFARSGYKFLFLEHLFYNTIMQDQLDAYFQSESETLPVDLDRYLNLIYARNYNAHFNFSSLIKEAKKHRIRVIGIDNEEVYLCNQNPHTVPSYSDNQRRMLLMNTSARDIIALEAGDHKWLALMGNSHISMMYDTPGVSQIIPNCAAIDIYGVTGERTSVTFSPPDRSVSEESKTFTIQREVAFPCEKDSTESLDLERLCL
jgi:hypothetical protein